MKHTTTLLLALLSYSAYAQDGDSTCVEDAFGVPEWMKVVDVVRRKSWNEFKQRGDFPADVLARDRYPVILTGTPANLWDAMERWKDHKYLYDKVGTVTDVVQANDKFMIYENADAFYHKHRNQLKDPSLLPPLTRTTTSMDIESLLHDPNVNAFYSQHLHGDFKEIMDDTLPRNQFVVQFDWMDCRAPGSCMHADQQIVQNSEFNVWMGQSGVTTGCHYDTSHNFYVQLSGRKRFIISPPQMWSQVRLHPSYHIRGRQSQREAIELDYLLFGKDRSENDTVDEHFFPHTKFRVTDDVSPVDVLVADLSPGDVLYLPPSYFHRVVALPGDPSISVNAWSPGKESVLHFEMSVGRLALPFETLTSPDMPAAMRNYQLMYYLRHLIWETQEMMKTEHLPPARVYGGFRVTPEADPSSSTSEETNDDSPEVRAVELVRRLITNYKFRPEMSFALGCDRVTMDSCGKYTAADEALVKEVENGVNPVLDRVVDKLHGLIHEFSADNNRPNTDGYLASNYDIFLTVHMERAITKTLPLDQHCEFLHCLSHAWVMS